MHPPSLRFALVFALTFASGCACGPPALDPLDGGLSDAADASPGDDARPPMDAALDAHSTPRDAGPDAPPDVGTDAGETFVPPPITAADGPVAHEAGDGVPECLRTTWGGAGSDRFTDLERLADGGWIAAGSTSPTTASYPAGWLVRLDGAGELVWSRAFGSSWRVSFHDVIATRDGGFAAMGSAQLRGPFVGLGDIAAVVVRVDRDGELLWARHHLGGDASTLDVALFETDDGELASIGTTTSGPSGTWDLFVSWSDPSGAPLRERIYDLGAKDEVCAAARASDGGWVLAGRRYATSDADDEPFAIRLDASGDEVWRRMLPTSHVRWSGAGERPCGVTALPGGGWAIALTDATDPFDQARRVAVLDSAGVVVRDAIIDAPGDHRAFQLASAGGGAVVVIGPSSGTPDGLDFAADRLDATGATSWRSRIGGSEWDYPRAIVQEPAGTFLVAGETHSVPDVANQGWIVRLTADGAFECAW